MLCIAVSFEQATGKTPPLAVDLDYSDTRAPLHSCTALPAPEPSSTIVPLPFCCSKDTRGQTPVNAVTIAKFARRGIVRAITQRLTFDLHGSEFSGKVQ